MLDKFPEHAYELRSEVQSSGYLEISVKRTALRQPAADEIGVKVEAAPINPSDIGMLLAWADPLTAHTSGEGLQRRITFQLSPQRMEALSSRLNLSLCPGLEGAGIVVVAGENYKHLIGKTVAMFGGGMFTEYRIIRAEDCLVFPAGTPPKKCAASFVNPLTALCMLDVREREGHKAIIHTVAASNLGQMLVKLSKEDGIDLINIVRRQEQVDLLCNIGAQYVCNSSSSNFLTELTELIRETEATLIFDAIGGGKMASDIILAMERVYAPEKFYMYGSTVHKQAYIYGLLDPKPIEISFGAGMAWSVSGFLMMNYLARLMPEEVKRMKDRIVRQIDTNFESRFTAEISLVDMLDPSILMKCTTRLTGGKYLLIPFK